MITKIMMMMLVSNNNNDNSNGHNANDNLHNDVNIVVITAVDFFFVKIIRLILILADAIR